MIQDAEPLDVFSFTHNSIPPFNSMDTGNDFVLSSPTDNNSSTSVDPDNAEIEDSERRYVFPLLYILACFMLIALIHYLYRIHVRRESQRELGDGEEEGIDYRPNTHFHHHFNDSNESNEYIRVVPPWYRTASNNSYHETREYGRVVPSWLRNGRMTDESTTVVHPPPPVYSRSVPSSHILLMKSIDRPEQQEDTSYLTDGKMDGVPGESIEDIARSDAVESAIRIPSPAYIPNPDVHNATDSTGSAQRPTL
jgi:hypothetical protein